MNANIKQNITRYLATGDVMAGLLAASYSPGVKAHPAPEAQPGARWHRGMHQPHNLQPTV